MSVGAVDRGGRSDPRIGALLQSIEAGDRPTLVGGLGSYAGLVLADLGRRAGRTVVLVAPDDARALELQLALTFFEHADHVLDPVPTLRALNHHPFSGMSPSRRLVMERTATLFRLVHELEVSAVVIPAAALLDRVVPRAILADRAELVIAGDTLDRQALLTFLARSGYHPVGAVEDPGTYAIRGSVVDVYAPLYARPIRMDFWGDKVEGLRFFDPSTQRSVAELEEVAIGPVRDVLFDEQTVALARERLFGLADDLEVPSSRARALVEDVESGILAVGMEDLLPAFFESLGTVFSAVPADALWIVDEPERCTEVLEARWEDVSARADRVRTRGGQMAFSAHDLFLSAEEAISSLESRTVARIRAIEIVGDEHVTRFDAKDHGAVRREIEAAGRDGGDEVLAPFTRRVRQWRERGAAVVVCAHSEGGVERLAGLLGHYGLKVDRAEGAFHLDRVPDLWDSDVEVHLFVGDPGSGFEALDHRLVLLDESELLGKKHRRRRREPAVVTDALLKSFQELREGDYVVHLLHGIGRYVGLTKTAVGALEVDFLVLEYAERNKLFVPVDRLRLVSKHTDGGGAGPRLDKLGGQAWEKRKTRVRKAVRDLADGLVAIYAERLARAGFAFPAPGPMMTQFEAAFPWEETPDQARTIEEVLADMQEERPMDRLLCGDVGFGKTEVAMRAAMLAVLGGKQVAILVPTLVLAEQHRLTFERRMDGFPVRVASLTRSLNTLEAREVCGRLASGAVDIVIGTHRLLSKDIAFKSLGLIIVDEEHRFGVSHKEALKKHRARSDVLTLTATPIPRTLHMSMAGIRDISLIQTPPVDRMSIRTLVAQPTEEVISDAILAELARGGQVFFVHNRVQDIEEKAELIRRLVPEARIAVGHGQMAPAALERVMLRFLTGEANVLVCTTIIESGLDIPNANTILINRADRFGLSQLYQLRGRVGRSSVRATCYLLVPSPRRLEGDAKERIATIQRFTELGSGFSIASQDLDIRGAGDLLGADQAGHIESVGYDTYMSMLREAVAELGALDDDETPTSIDPELSVSIEARLPESWIPDTTGRLRLYRDLAGAESVDAVYAVYHGAVDRFGRAPAAAEQLVELMALKRMAADLGLVSIGYQPTQLSLGLGEDGPMDGDRLTRFLNRPGNRYRVTPEMQIVRSVTQTEWSQGLGTLRESLREFENFVSKARP
jgi:transcription-repair coupling factor (superfamily II helicase)